MYFSYIMNYIIHFLAIHLFVNWTTTIALQGDNVRDAIENEFPFVVAISDTSNEIEPQPSNLRQFCTGSLITKKHVLTAEHCLLIKIVEEVEVVVGSIDLDSGKAYEPEKWTTWQQWKYNNPRMFAPFHHDVAVITLKQCVSEVNVSSAILSMSVPHDLFGTKVKVAGWGVTHSHIQPKILRTVDLKILSKAECVNKLTQIMKIQVPLLNWQLCATSEPWALNTCGDSGGPLINERNEVIGVTIGICPKDKIMLKKYPSQVLFMNSLMERRVNLYENLHYYQYFVKHEMNNVEAQSCSKNL